MTTFCTKPQNNLITQKFQFVLRRWDRPSQPQAEPHSLTTGTRKAQPHFPLEASFIRRGGCFFFLLALNRVSAHCSRRLQWIYCRWINSIICIIAPYLFDWTTAELLVVFAQQTTIFHIYFAHTFPPLAVSNEFYIHFAHLFPQNFIWLAFHATHGFDAYAHIQPSGGCRLHLHTSSVIIHSLSSPDFGFLFYFLFFLRFFLHVGLSRTYCCVLCPFHFFHRVGTNYIIHFSCLHNTR